MSNELNPKSAPSQPLVYQITLQGHLGRQWTDWFGDVTITLDDNGETLLTCPVVDQAALYGLLRMVRDLGLPLISVTRVQSHQAGGSAVKPHMETRSSDRRSTVDSTFRPCPPQEAGS